MSNNHNSSIPYVQVNREDDITTLTHVSMSGEELKWKHSQRAKLGGGRDGKVYLQTSSTGNGKRAIKIADKPSKNNKDKVDHKKELVEATREIKNHRNIAQIFQVRVHTHVSNEQ